ncbi:glycosyltransferase [Aquabacterium sp.]|uniref:glycosyltransferase n=1 Tax=Aquabacterium sp. TaxID=1872578 RepID=UPI0035B0BC39
MNSLILRTIQDAWVGLHQNFCFISATRSTVDEFWRLSPLGRSLGPLLSSNKKIRADIAFENTEALPTIYNNAIHNASKNEILIFLHDDVWLIDSKLTTKVTQGLNHFDIIGIAGNTRRMPYQPAWIFSHIENNQCIRDTENWSGAIRHGTLDDNYLDDFGPTPSFCELLDGVFLATRKNTLTKQAIHFDPQFSFDFYDMDFCRLARSKQLSLGTWPIDIIHQSHGLFGGDGRWSKMYGLYLEKWGS